VSLIALAMTRDNNKNQTKKRKRATVPPPPLPLIQLLQSDPSVLQYFQALQQSLEEDVRIWKNRYLALQNEQKAAKKSEQASKSSKAVSNSIKARKQTFNKTANNPKNNQHETPFRETMDIEDSMFDDDLSSDSSSNENDDHHENTANLLLPNKSDTDENQEQQQRQKNRLQEAQEEDTHPNDLFYQVKDKDVQIFRLLKQAYNDLERLGISLIEHPADANDETKESIEDAQKETDRGMDADEAGEANNEDKSHSDAESLDADKDEVQRIDEPASAKDRVEPNKISPQVPAEDKKVIEEINRALHALTRLYTETSEWGPFAQLKSTNDDECALPDRPCWQCPDHPAHVANERLFRALLVMDTFCDLSPSLCKSDKTKESESANIYLGMQQRKSTIQILLLFWRSQILEERPRTDRAALRESTVLVYDPFHQQESTFPPNGIIGGSKSWIRLAHLAERAWQSSLLTQLYLSRDQVQAAASLLIEYVQVTLPSLQDMEDYPQHPPILSLLVLESMTLLNTKTHDNWFPQWCRNELKEASEHLFRVLSLVIAVCGWIWKKRIQSPDDRIHDVAWVEFQCFQRLCQSSLLWLHIPFSIDDEKVIWQQAKNVGQHHLDELNAIDDSNASPFLCTSRTLLRILLGKTDVDMDEAVEQHNLLPKVEALRELRNRRQWPASKDSSTPWNHATNSLEDRVSSYLLILQNIMRKVREATDQEERVKLLTTALMASHSLADGRNALQAAEILVTCPRPLSMTITYRRALDTFAKIAQVPVVRVINLQKRTDRWQCFMNQASCQRLLVVKAVACLSDANNESTEEDWEFGGYAIDGTGPMVEAQSRMEAKVGSFARLNKLAAPQWRPHDLKAFDRGAPNHESLVSASMSEKACALSHIASWKGALRSFDLLNREENETPDDPLLFRHPSNMTRLFKIAGFAQGPPLIRQKQLSPPSPVCVILEDDAILVDHFAERLQSLLMELPRDFHICWLGYSRPKSAPIVPYTKRVGIPTMLWYLTGYILSEAGAHYLLNALPVVGPVDSWLGLKTTTTNWDNRFGVQVGVGTHGGSGTVQTPSRKELGQILQFRAYCAMKPLVAQRVSTTLNDTRGLNRNWRHFRDSDIEYSGDKVALA
jgi:GR25 family glycosyltransferase involved in LPS biosynthesis